MRAAGDAEASLQHRSDELFSMAEFSITRIVDRPRAAVYALAADVQGYADFIPGFADAQVRHVGKSRLEVVQRIRFKGLSARFRSTAELTPPERIVIRSHDRPFKELHQEWRLEDLGEGRTKITFSGHYELGSARLERWFGRWFDHLAERTVDAFEQRVTQDTAA